jgi:hypothetical protein
MSAYTLDTEAAKQADNGGARITETGKYVGQFTKAKKVLSTKGTRGIEFTFESTSGQTADYLTTWTINAEGDHIYGFKQLMALMTCLKARTIDVKPGKVEEYDRDSNGMVVRDVELYPALMNKPIGILLQMEEYQKKDGSVGEKAAFAGFFDPQTEQTAAEILEKREPEALAKMVANLVPVKKLKGVRSTTPASQGDSHGGGPAFDDTIPF